MGEISLERHKKGKYADPSPYPEVKVSAPNLCYACLLMDNYAGFVSEFTAINQYLYHHFLFEDIDKNLAELLKGVSINEMLHMEILADVIKKLGGNPMIRGSHSTAGSFWNGSFVHYGNELCEQLKADIDAEYKAIEEYKRNISLIYDSQIQAILERIILDEIVHIRLFNEALNRFSGCTYRQVD